MLSAEVAHVAVERIPVESVRISKRVVTETRTITVQVRREELHLERRALTTPADADSTPGRPDDRGPEPILVLVLHEEVPEVVKRIVAVEEIRVFIDDVQSTETVATSLRHEEGDVTTTERRTP